MLRHPFVIQAAAILANFILRLLYMTCKVRVHGLENIQGKKKLILMFWHNRITMAPQILTQYTKNQPYTAFVSNSRDGAYLTAMVEAYKHGRTIRVPHDARHEALRKAIRELKERDEIIIMTPDGPRGPRYEVKGGILLAARATKAPIVPMTWKANRYWEFKTWDRMLLPKPFSTIDVFFGEEIPSDKADEVQLKEKLLKL